MTNKEAIERIRDHIRNHKIGMYPHIKIAEALEMAIKALDKQISKKPFRRFDDDDEEWYDCPTCGRVLSIGLKIIIDHRYEYCSCCGQRIDWNDDDDRN